MEKRARIDNHTRMIEPSSPTRPPDWINFVETSIVVVDKDELITGWNRKTTEILGYSAQDLVGTKLAHISPSFALSFGWLAEVKGGKEDCTNKVVELTTQSGNVKRLDIRASVLRDHEGSYIGAVLFAEEVLSGLQNGLLSVSTLSTSQTPSHEEFVESSKTPIFTLDRNYLTKFWNRKAMRVTGFTNEDVLGKCFVESLVSEEDRLTTKTMLYDAFDGKETPNFRIKFVTKGGRLKYFLLNLTLLHDGELIYVGAQDTTEDMEKTRRTFIVAQELQSFLENAKTPIFGVDTKGMVNEWNNTIAEITGFSKDEVFYKPFVKTFIEPCCQLAIQEVLDHSLKGVELSNNDMKFRTKTGELRFFLFNANTRRDANNKVVGVIVFAQDITNVGRKNKIVEAMANELRRLIDKANAPIFGIDVDGDVNEWNDKIAEITGFAKDEVFDKHLVDNFIVPSLRHSVQEVLDKALQGDETSNYELEFLTISGEIRYLLVNATTRRDNENNIVGVLIIAQDVTEAAQHDRAVAAMARELRQLVDTANAPIFGIDINGNVNEWNDKTAEITGFTGDEAFNRSLVETFIVPKLRQSVQEVLDNALNGRGTSNYELEFRTKSNEIRYLLVNATTRRDAENNIVGVVGVAQDVTEAAKHDRAVAAMANELRQLIDTANAPIFGIDVDGDVNEWNDKTAEITGFTKEEAFDCPLVETFIVPSLRQSVQDVMDNALRGSGTSNYELEFRTKSNEIRHLLVNATTRRDAENNVVGVVGVAQDVTEAVQRDRAVAGMANELRQLIDTANAPIFGIDCDGNINEWNNKTAEITGYLKEEAFDEPLVQFIVPLLRKSVKEVMERGLQGNETANYELEFVTKSGEIRYLLVNATTRKDPESNIVGVVGVAQDVTEDRRHAKELREMQYLRASQEAKVETERNMTAYFAHELRNPLGAIDSALNAMPDDMPPSAKSLINGMQLCTGFMSSIMNNLLDVRKMEEGKMTLNAVAISLQALLDSVYKMLLPSIRPGVAFLKVCDTDERDWVLGDSHRIQQVMTNVITNAIKYTTSGSITLIIRWEGAFVKFECADTGPGIPKGEQKKLFERFVQRGGAPGTGLGLAIAKHLVDLTGGTIRFDSDPKVRPGTSCIVLMPLPICDPPDVGVQVDDSTLMDENISFLIIDDVKMNRMMLKRRIMKSIAPNAIIKEASTGEEALEICGKENFDVIVVDQYMEEAGGVMVGTDVVFAMRRMRILSIIIGCSGNDMDEQFAEAGADWVWKKPMPSNSEIIAELKTAMARRKMMNSAT